MDLWDSSAQTLSRPRCFFVVHRHSTCIIASEQYQANQNYSMHVTGQRRVRGGGTLHHMAPELVENYIAKTAGLPSSSFNGFACDMWALGVMLIQLLTGNLPFWPNHGFDYQSIQTLFAEWVSLRNI